MLSQLFHLPVEHRKHLLSLHTLTLERGQRIFKDRRLLRTLLLFQGETFEFFPPLTPLLYIEFTAIPFNLCGRQRPSLLLFYL